MTDSPRSLGDERTQAGLSSEAASLARSLGDQSTHAEGVSSVSDLGTLAANLDETLELTDLAARYELGVVIGRGGMGEVLLARDKRLERQVAIKRILGDGARSATALRRFLTEARSLAQLNHFNIVQIFDYGRDAQGPFLIMEYVAGSSLQDKLKAGPLPTEQAVDMVCQLCDGLSAAHERGIIHRDVKPANVLLTERGEPKLTDFGLAHRESGDGERTQAGAVLGTIDFMPPEQRRDATQADARSDLWSLAATLYQMLTGKSPKVIRLDQVPETLRPVLGKALEEEPAERYPTTVEFKAALRAVSVTSQAKPAQSASAALEEGVCPQCKTQNDLSRKFCRSCAASLSGACLGCGEETPAWEDVCGRCGTRQSVRLTELRGQCETRLEQAAVFGREYRFDESLALCEAVAQEALPSLADLRDRALTLTTELTARRDEQLRLQTAIVAEAQTQFDAAKYETVLTELEKIPAPLCDRAVEELRSEAQRRIVELNSLLTEIKRRVASKEHDGLEDLTARFLELQPTHAQVAKLHRQLLERAEKRRQQYDAAMSPAERAYAHYEDQRALAILKQLPASVRRDALHAAAATRLQRLQEIQERFSKTSNQADNQAEQLDLLREYLILRPNDEEAQKLLHKLVALYAVAPFNAAQAQAYQAVWAKHLGAPVEMTNRIGAKLILIPPGKFLMGSPKDDTDAMADEKPQHKVRITQPFYLSSTEVTQGHWQSLMGTEPWKGQIYVKAGTDYPATYVSWKEATEFCRKLSSKEGKTYRLPTEAEWEYACRAGTTTKYGFGDDVSRLGDYAWYRGDATSIGEKYAHGVGQKKPNAWGLYDMHGNVWEWCSDWSGDKYYAESPGSDPPGPASGSYRVFRGGSWVSTPVRCRSANRDGNTPDDRDGYLGFRVALVP